MIGSRVQFWRWLGVMDLGFVGWARPCCFSLMSHVEPEVSKFVSVKGQGREAAVAHLHILPLNAFKLLATIMGYVQLISIIIK